MEEKERKIKIKQKNQLRSFLFETDFEGKGKIRESRFKKRIKSKLT